MNQNEEIIREWLKEQEEDHYNGAYIDAEFGLHRVTIDGSSLNLLSLANKLDQLWIDKIKRAMPKLIKINEQEKGSIFGEGFWGYQEQLISNLKKEGIDLSNNKEENGSL